MRRTTIVAVSLFFVVATIATSVVRARADGNLNAVNHIIIMMQENHSFDNYFGVLPVRRRAVRTIRGHVVATIIPASTD